MLIKSIKNNKLAMQAYKQMIIIICLSVFFSELDNIYQLTGVTNWVSQTTEICVVIFNFLFAYKLIEVTINIIVRNVTKHYIYSFKQILKIIIYQIIVVVGCAIVFSIMILYLINAINQNPFLLLIVPFVLLLLLFIGGIITLLVNVSIVDHIKNPDTNVGVNFIRKGFDYLIDFKYWMLEVILYIGLSIFFLSYLAVQINNNISINNLMILIVNILFGLIIKSISTYILFIFNQKVSETL